MNTPVTLANCIHCAIVVGIIFAILGVWTGVMVLIADHGK